MSRSNAGRNVKSATLASKCNALVPARKQKARQPAGRQLVARLPRKSEVRQHLFQPEQMGKRFEFLALVIIEAHDQGKARGFEPLDVDFAHVDCRVAFPPCWSFLYSIL